MLAGLVVLAEKCGWEASKRKSTPRWHGVQRDLIPVANSVSVSLGLSPSFYANRQGTPQSTVEWRLMTKLESATPLVSVVVPTYKRPALLDRALESVRRQTYTNWEVLVVDDNAPTSPGRMETEVFMERYADEPRIKYVKHEENRGGSAARNTGIRDSQGSFVAFLDDDDEWLPHKLAVQVAQLSTAEARVGVVYGGAKILNHVRDRESYFVPHLRGEALPSLLGYNHIGTPSAILCRRSPLFEVGLFDETLEASQDYDLYLRLAKVCHFDYVKQPLIIRHKHAMTRITTDLDAKIRATERFYAKYEDEYEAEPEYRSKYRFKQGRLLALGGHGRRGALMFARAFVADRRNVAALPHGVLALLGSWAYKGVQRATWRLRRVLTQTLGRT